jgi:hypothetical protein
MTPFSRRGHTQKWRPILSGRLQYSKSAPHLPLSGLGHKSSSLLLVYHARTLPYNALVAEDNTFAILENNAGPLKTICIQNTTYLLAKTSVDTSMKGESYLQCAPLSILCSITARIGAIPVPGPTQITGTSSLVGSLMNPFLVPIWRNLPDTDDVTLSLQRKETDPPGFSVEMYEVQTPLRGTLSFVRYFTIATQRCICRGCLWDRW